MPANTVYKVSNRNDYSSVDLNLNYQGQIYNLYEGSPANCDFVLSDDCIIDGMKVSVIGGLYGDKISFQVIDKDNVLGYGANLVLGQFVTNWYIDPSSTLQSDATAVYPAKVKAGLYLRIIYYPTAVSLVRVMIVNYKLHKILW